MEDRTRILLSHFWSLIKGLLTIIATAVLIVIAINIGILIYEKHAEEASEYSKALIALKDTHDGIIQLVDESHYSTAKRQAEVYKQRVAHLIHAHSKGDVGEPKSE